MHMYMVSCVFSSDGEGVGIMRSDCINLELTVMNVNITICSFGVVEPTFFNVLKSFVFFSTWVNCTCTCLQPEDVSVRSEGNGH